MELLSLVQEALYIANPVEDSTDIILSGGYSTSSVLHYLTVIHVSGVPDPVSGLDYDDTVVIESSFQVPFPEHLSSRD